jgi:hypothetical protein
MMWIILLLLAIGLTIGVTSEIMCRKSKKALLTRPCAISIWRDMFPASTEENIREYLTLVADCYELGQSEGVMIQPSDRLIDIYHALYPPKWSAVDSLEGETFACELNKRYGFNINHLWSDTLTMGEVFEKANRSCDRNKPA